MPTPKLVPLNTNVALSLNNPLAPANVTRPLVNPESVIDVEVNVVTFPVAILAVPVTVIFVTLAVVTETLVKVTLPLLIVALVNVRLPIVVVVFPK